MIPHDLDAERSVLGFMLQFPHEVHLVADRLTANDFYSPSHGALFDVLSPGVAVPPSEAADRSGVSPVDLVSMLGGAPGPSWIAGFVDRLVALALRREALRHANDLAEAARADVGLDDALARIERLSSEGWSGRVGEEPPAYDEWAATVQTGYDWLIPGLLEKGDRLLFVARPGSGKSTMVRQFAVCLASGIHPFTFEAMPHMKVLFVDLENADRSTRRAVDPITEVAGRRFKPEMLRMEVRFGGMNLAARSDVLKLSGWVAAAKPDVLCIGPLYQMFGAAEKGDMGGEDQARKITRTLDRIRQRYGCALVMETHPPKGGTGSDLSVFGSGVWTRWPEFVEGIVPDPLNDRLDDRAEWRYELKPQRGRRDQRDFPKTLRYGKPGEFPWVPDDSMALDTRLREGLDF